jgi:hypothetical protein
MTRSHCRLVALVELLTLVTLGSVAGAQLVTGTVTNAQTTAPIAGAVVSLLDTAGAPSGRRVLTNDRGEFALRAPRAGEYLLDIRAIGFTPLRRRRVSLGDSETRGEDVALIPIVTRLANLRVETKSPCRRSNELDAVTTEVWDDVWAALASTEIAREQRMMRADVFIYVREVDVETGLVRDEERRLVPVLDERPFRTASPAELAQYGYWRPTLGGQVNLYGADAQTLMSTEFLAAHCFALTRVDAPTGVRIGLTFRPMRGDASHDVEGVLWIDPESRELRTLEYNYTGLPPVRGERAIGRMTFTRLPTGVWVDDHWLLRQPVNDVPQAGEMRTGRPAPSRRAPSLTVREGGGFVLSDSAKASRFVNVVGQIRRAATPAEGILGTTVELIGTELRVLANEDGTFNIGDVLSGTYEVRVMRSGSAESGGFVQHGTATLAGTGALRINVDVPADSVIARDLCPSSRGGTVPVFGVIRDEKSARTVTSYQMDIQYGMAISGASDTRIRRRVGGTKVTTDWRGEFLVCDVPVGAEVRFKNSRSGDDAWSDYIDVGSRMFAIDINVESPRPRRSP